MIGGTDTIITTRLEDDRAAALVRSCVLAEWPSMIIEPASGDDYWLYRDQKSKDVWDEADSKAEALDESPMIFCLFRGGEVTIVTNTEEEKRIAQIIEKKIKEQA